MNFSNLILVVIFTFIFALTFYLVANERSHVQPKYFFIAAVVIIFLGYCFKIGSEVLDEPGRKNIEKAQVLESEANELSRESRQRKDEQGPNFNHLWMSTLQNADDWRLTQIKVKRQDAKILREEATSLSIATLSAKHISELMLLVSGAFAGALASTAITNRAKFQHDRSVLTFLEMIYSEYEIEAKKLAASIPKYSPNSSPDGTMEREIKNKICELSNLVREMELLSEYITQKEFESFDMTVTSRRAKRQRGGLLGR